MLDQDAWHDQVAESCDGQPAALGTVHGFASPVAIVVGQQLGQDVD